MDRIEEKEDICLKIKNFPSKNITGFKINFKETLIFVSFFNSNKIYIFSNHDYAFIGMLRFLIFLLRNIKYILL